MSKARADEWLRRIELYLDVGSEGVVVLVERARDAHIGRLVRVLLPKHPEMSIVVSPGELRDAAKGSVVVYHAEAGDAERLNLIRPVLKDRGLRVVLWAQGELASELPLRAPDLYDWISHRVLCPQEGAPPFVSAGLRAAAAADRPVAWEGSLEELRAAAEDAWPDTTTLRVDARNYDAVVEGLAAHPGFVIVDAGRRSRDVTRARWAMGEARRHRRVGVLADFKSVARRGIGLWRLTSRQAALKKIARDRRVRSAAVDLESEPVEWLKDLPDSALDSWRTSFDDEGDPGVTLARHFASRVPVYGSDVATGRAPAVILRAFGADPRALTMTRWPAAAGEQAWYAAAIADPTRTAAIAEGEGGVPLAVQVELGLWVDPPPWPELAEKSAGLGEHEIATRWDLHHGSTARGLEEHIEKALVGVSLLERARILRTAAARLDGSPRWLDSLQARIMCDAGDLHAAGALSVDAATDAYVQSIAGDWKRAIASLREVAPTDEIGDLRMSGLGLAAWACDAAALARTRLVPEATDGAVADSPRMGWKRWLLPLGFESSKQLPRKRSPAEVPLESLGTVVELPAEAAVSRLAAAAYAERLLDHQAANVHAARGLACVEEAFAPREHVLEGVLLMMQGRALARLAQPDRATGKLSLADTIVRRTTGNDAHPWALIARFEHAWLRAQHRGGPVEAVDAALQQLEDVLWPEHRDLREARKLRARLAPRSK